MPRETMKVIIKEREVDYVSDYPDGWKFSAGDPFKFPVLVGGNPCFIKRFEQKSPEEITGWDLLVKMTGKYEKTLSRVYDIKNVQEEGKEIYYVFYEHLDGITLDKAVRERADINLTHLNNDLFSAMRALHGYGFWFADFTEKNIFCQKDGSFVLVDVDSTQRIADLPDNDMYGSKDYWILVLKFYKEILNKNDLRLSDINGISLNYLQVPFLVLRLKQLLTGNGKDYNSPPVFNQLPSRLNEMSPEFRDIYLNVIKNGKDAISKDESGKIEDIVDRKIIRGEYIPEVPGPTVSLPVITGFKTSVSEIQSGGSFTLSWAVENADKLELYKNGAKFLSPGISQKEVSLKEFADGTRQQSSYQLIAYKDLDMAKSEAVIIKLKDSGETTPIIPVLQTSHKDRKPFKIGTFLIGIVVLGAIFLLVKYLLNKKEEPVVKDTMEVVGFLPRTIIEGKDSTITFYGRNFPDTGSSDFNKVEVSFNGTRAKILQSPENTIKAVAPVSLLKQVVKGNRLSIPFEVRLSGANLFSDTVICILDKTIKLVDFIPKNLRNRATVIFTGKNLDVPGNFAVRINNIQCRIVFRDANTIITQAPDLPEDLSSLPVELLMGGNLIYKNEGNTLRFKRFDVQLIKADFLEKEQVKMTMQKVRIHQ